MAPVESRRAVADLSLSKKMSALRNSTSFNNSAVTGDRLAKVFASASPNSSMSCCCALARMIFVVEGNAGSPSACSG